MSQAEKVQATLFISDLQGHHETRKPVTEAHVGIWWHNGTRIVGFAQAVTSIQEPRQICDSNLAHADTWDIARKYLSCSDEAEYFSVPRGRILWHKVNAHGIVYHGNATQTPVLQQVARLFGLSKWEARLDVHYLTGDALEEFYSIDE